MSQPSSSKMDAANAKSRASESLRLYIAGNTFRQIAERLGVSVGTAHRDVKLALADAAKERQDLAEGLLEAQIERLQDAMSRVTQSEGYQDGDPASVNAFIKACESLRKLLGLDQPTKVEEKTDGTITVKVEYAKPKPITDDESDD